MSRRVVCFSTLLKSKWQNTFKWMKRCFHSFFIEKKEPKILGQLKHSVYLTGLPLVTNCNYYKLKRWGWRCRLNVILPVSQNRGGSEVGNTTLIRLSTSQVYTIVILNIQYIYHQGWSVFRHSLNYCARVLLIEWNDVFILFSLKKKNQKF